MKLISKFIKVTEYINTQNLHHFLIPLMESLLETNFQTATQNPLIYHKVPRLQLNLNIHILVRKKIHRLTFSDLR